jgi:hypothetical protein
MGALSSQEHFIRSYDSMEKLLVSFQHPDTGCPVVVQWEMYKTALVLPVPPEGYTPDKDTTDLCDALNGRHFASASALVRELLRRGVKIGDF